MISISIKRVSSHSLSPLPLPAYQTADSAGMDLLADVTSDVELLPLKRTLVPTGFSMEIPRGYEAQIRPRSGLAFKNGIVLPNSPGTIDSDYRGEVKVIVMNLGEEPFVIKRGDRIAQMVIAPVMQVELKEEGELSNTVRGAGGFGSTGV